MLSACKSKRINSPEVVSAIIQTAGNSLFTRQLKEVRGEWKKRESDNFILVLIDIRVINQSYYFVFEILNWTFNIYIVKFSISQFGQRR